MRAVFGNSDTVTREIGGQFCPAKDRIARRKFGIVAKALWPENTDAHIASIVGADVRTARRWIAGEFEPPARVIAAVIVEITKLE